MSKIHFIVEPDSDTECPYEWGSAPADIYRFRKGPRTFEPLYHGPYDNAEDFLFNNNNNVCIGARSKLNAGTAFLLVYGHNSTLHVCEMAADDLAEDWRSLAKRVAVAFIKDSDVPNLRKLRGIARYRARKAALESWLELYNTWVQGYVYYVRCSEEAAETHGLDKDSCGSIYDMGDLEAEIRDCFCVPDDVDVTIEFA